MALRSLATRKALTLGLSSTRLAQSRALQTFSLPDLPYDYGALEPAISGEIMQLHHQKHHQTYITNYNKALEQLHEAIQKGDSSTVVKLQSAIKFNGGGKFFFVFFFFFCVLWIMNTLCMNFTMMLFAALQGSGWVWLGVDKEFKKLVIEITANQDPLVTKGVHLVPLLGIDVWEHAYYLQYKNVRPDYLKNIWNVINWKYASEVYEKESA
ncbi:superoxide dismutase [Mn], mitochondrial-like [Durio zibethinus]|uniref:Superoxide dismutase n=1 Tax=Durio zibethinus TaxID=66656 RepID=A0A6P6AH94_DURZI|nr:superoxide dismutase [Mn], mitochondrial-like [Durio zibethinus]